MLDTEMDVHLGRKTIACFRGDSLLPGVAESFVEPPRKAGTKNRRNGHSEKTVQGDLGKIMIATPRNRDGTSSPS